VTQMFFSLQVLSAGLLVASATLSPGDSPLCSHATICFSPFFASDHQKLLRTVKYSTFQSASIKIDLTKIIQNQHKHRISRVVAIVRIHHFLDLRPYEHLQLPSHIILTIFRFSSQPDSPSQLDYQKSSSEQNEPNRPRVSGGHRTGGCLHSLHQGLVAPFTIVSIPSSGHGFIIFNPLLINTPPVPNYSSFGFFVPHLTDLSYSKKLKK
jgi:hypothetical protein